MTDKNEYDPVVENIHKIRKKISKKIENMSLEERNAYLNKETEEFFKLSENQNNKIIIEQKIIDYYKSIYGSSYVNIINRDLENIIEFRKSL